MKNHQRNKHECRRSVMILWLSLVFSTFIAITLCLQARNCNLHVMLSGINDLENLP